MVVVIVSFGHINNITFKKAFGEIKTFTTVMGKYIHLQDKNSNAFSRKAQNNYFTPGLKIHAHYHDYHMGAGAFFGKRAFAVMYNGFKVQHHAMEFNKTYMFGIGKHFGDLDVSLHYVYQEATELPINNDNVKAKNLILQVAYRFRNDPKGLKAINSSLFKNRKKRLLKFFIANSKYSGAVNGCDANFCGTNH